MPIKQQGFVLLTTTIILAVMAVIIMDVWQLVAIESKLSFRFCEHYSVVVKARHRANNQG